MKNILLLLVLALTLSAGKPDNSPFCYGFEAGYISGWCYQDPFCLEPLTPLCPLPRIGEDGYQDGYNRGFIQGMYDRSKKW